MAQEIEVNFQALKIKFCARWRIDQYSQWNTRYFDTEEDLLDYWNGFHSILAPDCIKESYKIVYTPLVIHGKEKYYVQSRSDVK